MEREPVVGYMCKVDFEHELGQASGGDVVCPSVEDLKLNRKCWDECGIVGVEVRLRSIVHGGRI